MAPTWPLAEATDAARDPDLRHRIGPAVDQPVVVAVPGADDPDHAWIAATRLVRRLGTVVIGVGDRPRPAFDVIDSDPGPLADAVRRRPQTASIAAEVLRLTEHTEAATARQIESLAYAALQGGPEHASWLASRGRRVRRDDAPRVRVDDDGDTLTVTLTRGRLHNLLDTAMRDELADVFVALAQDERPIVWQGDGASFCAGGDPAEFGSVGSGPDAHLIRNAAGLAPLLDTIATRTTARLHGAVVGAGVELSALCARVVAARDTRFRLPELQMGLIPGVGGSWSIPRRIGRHRTLAWLLLDRELDADTALEWGLIDEIVTSS